MSKQLTITKPTSYINKHFNFSDDGEDDSPTPAMNLNELLPRVDISPMITESLIAELMDKNWKTRNEGLIKLQAIMNEHKLLKPSLQPKNINKEEFVIEMPIAVRTPTNVCSAS
jgi:hypothetical protein